MLSFTVKLNCHMHEIDWFIGWGVTDRDIIKESIHKPWLINWPRSNVMVHSHYSNFFISVI